MHLPRRYLRGLVLVFLIISLHIHVSENVTWLLAPVWDEGHIYASTEGDAAVPSPDVSGSWVGIFITPWPACTMSLPSMMLRGFPALRRRGGRAVPPPARQMESKGIYLL